MNAGDTVTVLFDDPMGQPMVVTGVLQSRSDFPWMLDIVDGDLHLNVVRNTLRDGLPHITFHSAVMSVTQDRLAT